MNRFGAKKDAFIHDIGVGLIVGLAAYDRLGAPVASSIVLALTTAQATVFSGVFLALWRRNIL